MLRAPLAMLEPKDSCSFEAYGVLWQALAALWQALWQRGAMCSPFVGYYES